MVAGLTGWGRRCLLVSCGLCAETLTKSLMHIRHVLVIFNILLQSLHVLGQTMAVCSVYSRDAFHHSTLKVIKNIQWEFCLKFV